MLVFAFDFCIVICGPQLHICNSKSYIYIVVKYKVKNLQNICLLACVLYSHMLLGLAKVLAEYFFFFLGHHVNMNGHAQHITCVGLQQSKTMSHFAPSLLYAVTEDGETSASLLGVGVNFILCANNTQN